MTERQQHILKTIIEEYIKDAQPVGSKKLAERFNFGIKPAMIRQEMVVLEGERYIAQPHTSAGRVPTDKAYRFYITNELDKKRTPISPREQEKILHSLNTAKKDSYLLKEVSRLAADLSREFSAAGLLGHNTVYTHGLSRLMEEPELQDFDHLSHLMHFVDEIDSYFEKLWARAAQGNLRVFIGSENPIEEIQDFTLITGLYRLSRRQVGFLSIIGPRRMDYKRNMALVEHIGRAIDELVL